MIAIKRLWAKNNLERRIRIEMWKSLIRASNRPAAYESFLKYMCSGSLTLRELMIIQLYTLEVCDLYPHASNEVRAIYRGLTRGR